MWKTPKTDWHGEVIDNKYVGDFFNAEDYNRIKNNLEYLQSLAIQMYNDFTINSVGEDKTPSDYFYADEMNKIEDNLEIINNNTFQNTYGDKPVFVANGKTMNFEELNRIEKAILDIFNKLNNQSIGRRKFEWNFGTREDF